MGKTKHSKIALRIPTNYVSGKERKEYQDNEMPKNKPGSLFFKHGIFFRQGTNYKTYEYTMPEESNRYKYNKEIIFKDSQKEN